ncbi:hypothetical protein INQ51_21320 [Maribellus sp. CM-23]|uniref:hypothetical protein n=1 Tax=Maribellus sp. CM-23 TaxID=2781026 RepID=UPI001F16886C|nr:hypothetical protein [Maribellus sp. CM-23]MCE4566877.1 hypothetical protein [Maribellus sp. CM-23]
MKTNILLSLSFLILFPIFAFAQNDIRQQIIGYTDSTEIIIRNGRKMVVDKTIHGDSQGATETINFLKNNVNKDYVIFYPVEELLLALTNSNFEQFLFAAANFDNLLEGKTNYIQVENITGQLQMFLGQELTLIKKDLERTNLPAADKELIELYIRYFEGEDIYKTNRSILAYRKSYPDTKYSSFLELIQGYVAPYAMNFCLGYGHEFLNGNINQNFTSHFQSMNFELEWFFNQLYLSLFFQGSVGQVHSKVDMPVKKHDLIHTPDDNVFAIKYGLKIGKAWVTTQHINFFSYVSVGNYQMKSDKSNFDIPDDETANLKLTSVFSPGIGTACDINLKRFKSKFSGENVGKWFIRPNVSYDFFLTGKEKAKGGSLFAGITMGIGIGN